MLPPNASTTMAISIRAEVAIVTARAMTCTFHHGRDSLTS